MHLLLLLFNEMRTNHISSTGQNKANEKKQSEHNAYIYIYKLSMKKRWIESCFRLHLPTSTGGRAWFDRVCSRLNTKHVDLCTHLIEIISNKYYWLWLSWMISNEAGKYTADHLLPSRATRHSCGRFCLCVSLRLLSLSIIFISNRFIKCIYLHTSYSKSHKILRHLIFFSLSTWMILVVDVNPHNWRVHTLLSTILSRYFSHKRNTESNDA